MTKNASLRTRTTPRAVIYARISDDPLGKELGVTRQVEDAQALVRDRGWTLVGDPLVDNDVSALNGKRRAGYDEVMRLVDSRAVDKVVVFQTSRLWRNRQERAEGIERLRRASVGLTPVKGTELDLGTASGRVIAGVLGEFDTFESEVKAERVARAARQRAESGQANGALPYGWRRVRERDEQGRVTQWHDEEHPEQAPVVREIVERLLAGDPVIAITRDLNERGVPSPNGKRPWCRSTIRAVALRETNVARRTYRGELLDVPAAWPALVDIDQHERVKALLHDPARGLTRDGKRKYLLSYSVGECGVCGSHLLGAVGFDRRTTKKDVSAENPTGLVLTPFRRYACATKRCVARDMAPVDALVGDVVAERLTRPDAVDLLAGDDGQAKKLREKAVALRARLDNAADDYADGTITREQLRRITAKLAPQVDDLEARAVAAAGPSVEVLADLVGQPDARARWDALPVARQVAVLEALGVRVVLDRTRKGQGFNETSVRVLWGTT